MIQALLSRFLKRDLNSILSVFSKTVANLEAHVKRKFDEARQHELAAEEATKRRAAAWDEGTKANSIKNKLENLLKD